MAPWTMNTLVRRNVERSLRAHAQRHLRGVLIDIGCGTKPYKELLAPLVEKHVGLDHEGSLHDPSEVDLTGSAYAIPAEDESFDSALCTFALEHLEEPETALRECHRVLKRGGTAIYQVPFIWHLHEEPRDFFRFSKYGLEHLFCKTGFELVTIEALSGFWLTFGQLLVYYLYRFNRGPLRWLRIMDGVCLVLQGLFYALDRLDRAEGWTHGYTVVARKP
jgi:ubiquinone/menaquinone biosynthesis C-methylase UbiE